MEQPAPTTVLRDFLSQINAALAPLQPIFALLDDISRLVEHHRPSPSP